MDRHVQQGRVPLSSNWARKSGLRQCWSITLVVKGLIFLAIFAWLSSEFTSHKVFGFTWPSSFVNFVHGVTIFACVVSSLQVVLGLYVCVQDCCPPQRKLAVQLGGYVGWIILTLCELPGFVVAWTLSIALWTVDGNVQAWVYPLTVGLSIWVTVTSVMAHSHRPRWEEQIDDVYVKFPES